MEKKKGMIPSIIFGSIILLSILALTFFILNGESILEGIKDGFTDEGYTVNIDKDWVLKGVDPDS
ncbi:hypothetical protein [Rossellomorea vietnamensis]|uniref:Uncharacterized protein n=1 Tax=Rossellomorea vietnamensis TaxID=218284 RepID=A0A0P6WAK3_9BACI|nr:hypothetical protein [Rossellomorea vietnamensis]KPL57743.1 hypothetical protein AM506_20570 [Rossellomorea vietnamensis]